MNVGDRVICIDNINTRHLEKGRKYTIIDVTQSLKGDFLSVKDDEGKRYCSYRCYRFELDIRYMRKKKLRRLNSLLL